MTKCKQARNKCKGKGKEGEDEVEEKRGDVRSFDRVEKRRTRLEKKKKEKDEKTKRGGRWTEKWRNRRKDEKEKHKKQG